MLDFVYANRQTVGQLQRVKYRQTVGQLQRVKYRQTVGQLQRVEWGCAVLWCCMQSLGLGSWCVAAGAGRLPYAQWVMDVPLLPCACWVVMAVLFHQRGRLPRRWHVLACAGMCRHALATIARSRLHSVVRCGWVS